MAASVKHRGWLLRKHNGVLAAVYNTAQEGTTSLTANTALDGVLTGTPVITAIPVDSLVFSNTVASGDIVYALNDGSGNSWEYLRFDASAGLIVFNEASSNIDFRVESNNMIYAIAVDGGKDALVLGSNTDTSSADQLITVSRAARTATANTSYYDLRVAPAGAVTVPTGTTAVVATVSLVEPNVTATGTVTRAATLHIASQPTEGATANAAILFGAAANIAATTSLTINDDGEDVDFRVETDGIQYAIYSDGGKNALVLGSNTDTSSADQLITVSRAARTATANTDYFDIAVQPAGAVTVPTGTTAVVATVSINEPNVTATGTVTRAATLHIASQPTEGGTANAAIFFGAAANIACTTSLTFNEDSEDINFRFETNDMAYAIYSDGGKNALVLGSNTDTSSADQLITVSRAARTATANTAYYDLAVQPAGAVTVPTGTTAVVASLMLAEPNITATGTVTLSAVLYISGVATEATDDFAIYAASGPISTGIATATNVTGNVGLFSGGIAMTDVLNAWIDDATHGNGTTTHYIGNQTITTSSDSRVKTDIKEFEGSAFDILRQAESLKEFHYNLPGGGPQDSGYGPNARGKYLGFKAQETLKWAPWVVNAGAGAECPKCLAGEPCDKHSFFAVEYQHLIPLMVQGMKELDARLANAGI